MEDENETSSQQVVFVAHPPPSAHDIIIPCQITDVKKHVMPKLFIASGYAVTWSKVIIAIIDMTAQIDAQQALAEREAQMRLIFDYAYDGVSLHEEFPALIRECISRRGAIARLIGTFSRGYVPTAKRM